MRSLVQRAAFALPLTAPLITPAMNQLSAAVTAGAAIAGVIVVGLTRSREAQKK